MPTMPGYTEDSEELNILINAEEILTDPTRRNELAIIFRRMCDAVLGGANYNGRVRNEDIQKLICVMDFIAHTDLSDYAEMRENTESFIQAVDLEQMTKEDLWSTLGYWLEDTDHVLLGAYKSVAERRPPVKVVVEEKPQIKFGQREVTVKAIVEDSINKVKEEVKMASNDYTIEQLQAMLAAKQEEAKTRRESALFTALEAFYRDGGNWEDVMRISKLVTQAIKKPEVKPKAPKAAKENKGVNVFVMSTKLNKLVSNIKKLGNKFDFTRAGLGSFEEYKATWKGINWRNDMEKSKHLDTIVAKLQSDCTYEEFVAAIMANEQ